MVIIAEKLVEKRGVMIDVKKDYLTVIMKACEMVEIIVEIKESEIV